MGFKASTRLQSAAFSIISMCFLSTAGCSNTPSSCDLMMFRSFSVLLVLVEEVLLVDLLQLCIGSYGFNVSFIAFSVSFYICIAAMAVDGFPI